MLNDIADFFSDLKGIVTESVRAIIVRRFCRLISDSLKKSNKDGAYRRWLAHDQNRFVRECKITDMAVQEDLKLEPTALSKFCDRWLRISSFRINPDSSWRPITPEMNSIRVTMVNELKALATGENTINDLTTSSEDGTLVE